MAPIILKPLRGTKGELVPTHLFRECRATDLTLSQYGFQKNSIIYNKIYSINVEKYL
jgi:hypothetical protein